MAKRGFSNNTLNDEEDGEDLLLDRYLDSSVRWVVRKTDHGRSHTSRYSIHPGADKMYHESERFVLWPGKKKKDIVESLADVMVDLRHTYDSSSRSVRYLCGKEWYDLVRKENWHHEPIEIVERDCKKQKRKNNSIGQSVGPLGKEAEYTWEVKINSEEISESFSNPYFPQVPLLKLED
ncbi:hypothetical protein Tco_0110422 [Tanacetum coccineum]